MIAFTEIVTIVSLPEPKETKSGHRFAAFKIKTEKKSKDSQKESVWECNVWGDGQCKNLENRTIGEQIFVRGTIEMQSWDYQGKQYSKPLVTVSAIGLIPTTAPLLTSAAVMMTSKSFNQPQAMNFDDVPF